MYSHFKSNLLDFLINLLIGFILLIGMVSITEIHYRLIKRKGGKMQLSEHFSLSEATNSNTATRLGIENTPNNIQLANMKVAAAGMEQVRAVLGCPIHTDSWLRVEELEKVLTKNDYNGWCVKHGKVVSDSSWDEYFARKGHPKGFAVDFICPQFGTPAEIVTKLKTSGIKFDQLIMEGTWVHVSFDPQMRGQLMTATFVKGQPTYTMGA